MPRAVASTRQGESTRTVVIILAVVGLGLVLLCGGIGAVAVGLPAWQQTRQAAQRDEAQKRLQELHRAVEQYHDAQASGPFPDTGADSELSSEPLADESQ